MSDVISLFDFMNIDTSGAEGLSDEMLLTRIAANGYNYDFPGWGNLAEALKRLARTANVEDGVAENILAIKERSS